MLEDILFLVKQTPNLFLIKKVEKLIKLIETTPNDLELGAKIRKLLKEN